MCVNASQSHGGGPVPIPGPFLRWGPASLDIHAGAERCRVCEHVCGHVSTSACLHTPSACSQGIKISTALGTVS